MSNSRCSVSNSILTKHIIPMENSLSNQSLIKKSDIRVNCFKRINWIPIGCICRYNPLWYRNVGLNHIVLFIFRIENIWTFFASGSISLTCTSNSSRINNWRISSSTICTRFSLNCYNIVNYSRIPRCKCSSFLTSHITISRGCRYIFYSCPTFSRIITRIIIYSK